VVELLAIYLGLVIPALLGTLRAVGRVLDVYERS